MVKDYLIKMIARLALASILGFSATVTIADSKITLFAAASLTNAMTDIAKQYETEQSVKIQSSFAASSALAKQIENGAPADIFMAADSKWMNYLQEKMRIEVNSRVNLLGNKLVLIAPKGKAFKVQPDKTFNFANAFYGKLCTGEIESVPVGIYAKQSLIALNWWDSVKSRIVGTQDVRAALVFVERGECDVGIVYETDAKVSSKVEIIATFPETTHDAIVYPIALVQDAKPVARDFFQYLKSDQAKAILTQDGCRFMLN
ncbi:MAG: molybdate ABC transporter substrate-binding protein [Methylophilaceae bacterium]